VFPIAPPLDFSKYITDRTRDFTGREWVFRAIDNWLADPEGSRVFLLTGEPGCGKTAVAARLVQTSQGGTPAAGLAARDVPSAEYPNLAKGAITFYQFCQAFHNDSLDPLRFTKPLSLYLARQYPPFAEALTRIGTQDPKIHVQTRQEVGTVADQALVVGALVVVENLTIGDLSARVAFDRVVAGPLKEMCETDDVGTLLILVDALDEALTYPGETLVDLLGHVLDDPRNLPPQVRFLLTSRPDDRVIHLLGQPTLDLIRDAPADVEEVRTYAHRRLHTLDEPRRSALAGRIAAATKGNFLYARHVIDDLLSDLTQIEDVTERLLPEDLHDVYRQFLKRELARSLDTWDDDYAPLLGVLAVARGDGLTSEQLAAILEPHDFNTGKLLRACGQYLAGPHPDGPFCIYHQSFREFLLTDEEYQVDATKANTAVAHTFLRDYADEWLECDEHYALQNTATHLVEATKSAPRRHTRKRMTQQLVDLLTNLHYWEAKSSLLGTDSLLSDLKTAALLDTLREKARADLTADAQVLGGEALHLRAWNRVRSPAYFAQQMRNRAVKLGVHHLVCRAEARLAEIGQSYVAMLQHAGHPSAVSAFPAYSHVTVLQASLETPFGRWPASIAADSFEHGSFDLRASFRDPTLPYLIQNLTVGWPPTRVSLRIHNDGVGPEPGEPLRLDHKVERVEGHFIGVKIHSLCVDREDALIQGWIHVMAETKVRVAPHGDLVVCALPNGILRAWDLQTGQTASTMRGHEGPISAMAFTPDGQRLVSASVDGSVRVWDLEHGAEAFTLQGDRRGVCDIVVTPDGRRAISAGADEVLKVWDLETRQEEETWAGHSGPVVAMALTSDAGQLVSASWDQTLRVWHVGNGTARFTLAGHDDWVTAVAVTPDARFCVSASTDHTLKVWDLVTGRHTRTLHGHESRVWSVVLTPDGDHAVSVADDDTVRLWHLHTGENVSTVRVGHAFAIGVVGGGQQVAVTGCWNNRIVLWDLNTQQEIAWATLDTQLGHLYVDPDRTRLFVGDTAGGVYCLRYVEAELSASAQTGWVRLEA